ncbi:ribosome small subunit-dependent GTPase A [Arthrobacter sp. Soc17.1.1.1]|uniref:ribosome small subunit-dependent GTPase A n=1 Tax=Arthrobacter sp. Soc17.1.1.1 TaxID=3121277 RepID=UPI002FE4B69E
MNTLEQYGFTDRIGGLFSFHFPGPISTEPARVIRSDRGRVLVASRHGILHLDGGSTLVTGDWAAVRPEGTVIGCLPRSSLLRRKRAYDPLSEAQVLGANIDLLGVVVPLDRPLSTNRLERTLVAAWDSGAVPIVVLTKADLSTRFNDVVAETVQRARGVEVLTTSAEDLDGLEELRGRIGAGQTLALLGPSGAGKSSLINALVGDPRRDTGEVRAGDARGRHTTTARELVPLGDGAVVMDTPGLRGFALWDAEAGLSEVFGDIEELFGGCRFRDCAHGSEPGCAVQAAIGSGALEERRWLSYRKMERELASLHRRQDAVEQRRHERSFQRVAREAALAKDHRNRFREGR